MTCIIPLGAQNENAKWYFGNYAGLDFMSNPPTIILNSNVPGTAYYSSAISDASGNLLFYTDGITAWNSLNSVIPNGTSLGNSGNIGQILIVKQPGTFSQFYLFNTTLGNTLIYSIMDMTLSAGQGSVTVKNIPIGPASGTGKLTGTYHCNGIDQWIVYHRNGNNNTFRAYLLTAAGVNTVAVTSNVGSNDGSTAGQMKISPSGNKVAVATQGGASGSWVEVSDFNNSNGTVTNPLLLMQLPGGLGGRYFHGAEFSPDGSKLYATEQTANNCLLHQWDLCAGSPTAVVASHYTISVTATGTLGDMQLAKNGKIYIVAFGSTSLHVINAPNNYGSSCNFIPYSQSISPNAAWFLPKFITRHKNVPGSFSYSVTPTSGCHALSFTPAPNPSVSCASANFSVMGISWDFGDPLSGSSNASNATNPIHLYPAPGNYTVMQVFYFPCGSDTIRQVVNVPPPTISVLVSPSCGSNGGSATVIATGGTGPYSYTWYPSMKSSQVATSLASGIQSVTVYDQGLQCLAKATFTIINLNLPVLSVSPSTLVIVCLGSQAAISLSGTSSSFSWNPSGGLSLSGNNTLFVSSNVTQNYTITGITSPCSASVAITASVVSLPSASITTNNTVTCANDTISLSGSGGLNYIWKLPDNSNYYGSVLTTVPRAFPFAIYMLTVKDINGCEGTTSKSVAVLSAPSGSLDGFKQTSCAPYCGSFSFISQTKPSKINALWNVNGQKSEGMVTFCLINPGNYTLTGNLTDSLTQCTSNINYSITVLEKPTAGFTYSPERITVYLDEPVFTAATDNLDDLEFTWYFTQGYQTTKKDGYEAIFVYNEVGSFPVALTVKNTYGCIDTLIKTITVRSHESIYVPNCFTPNDDNLNDIFKPVVTGMRKYKFSVFDRWGEKIFETSDVDKGWDGTYKGERCKSDTYGWMIEVVTEDESKLLTGHVLLIKGEN